MQYEKNGIFAFMGRRDELCIRNLNTQLHDRMITAMKKCYYSQAPLPSVVKEAPVLQEEYIPLFFVKIYKTARVSKQFDPLFCFFR